ncbi:MAG: hypothetical protein D6725_00705 [Planctomycetota bacterium]|nr:MAG: hypothetical protein D6725_00705 [Planctomycetota bacterium]
MKAAISGVQRSVLARILDAARTMAISPLEALKSVLGFVGGLLMLTLGLLGAALATVVGIVVGFIVAVIPVLLVSGLIQAVYVLFFA